MNPADIIQQLLAPGQPGTGAVAPPLPLVPPGQPLPPSMPGPANAPLAGLIAPQSFPQPSLPSTSAGGGPAPTPPPDAGGSAPGTNAPGQGMPGPSGSLPPPEYVTRTQSDGSVLMSIKNPDGTSGPVVKIISPPKRGLHRAAEMAQVK